MYHSEYKTIYLDFDNVIVDSIKAIVELYNEDYQYYKKFQKVNWWEVYSWDFQECKCAKGGELIRYFNQPRFFQRVEIMPWAERVINDLSEFYKIKIVSLGYNPNLYGKSKWLNKKFPGIEFIGINMNKYDDKSCIDMCDGILIDDSVKNLEQSNASLKICFGDIYEWNKTWNGIRLKNWMDIRNYLL